MQCIFCDIGRKTVKAKVVWESDKYMAFEDINPHAPVHIIVIPKEHMEKTDTINGLHKGFWDEIYAVAHEVIQKYELNETGYKIVNNGAGYNHLEHEHLHVLGGNGWTPNYQP